MFEISVIICAHNPRQEFLERTLNALKEQSLEYEKWHLILVDNASDSDLSLSFDLSWHPNAKHIKEEKIGLTHARLKGIENAEGKLCVFVDDDNVLDSKYLEKTIQIALEFPRIGAFGGILKGDFEIPPPQWMKPHLSWLAVRDVTRDVWSNSYIWETTPSGAGMVVRAEIAQKYAVNTKDNPVKQLLGRSGNNTISGEDGDIAYTSIDMGFGCGRFKKLSLVHIIPKQRLKEEYLIKLHEGIVTSKIILDFSRNPNYLLPKHNAIKQLVRKAYNFFFESAINNKIAKAKLRGIRNAKKIIYEISGNSL